MSERKPISTLAELDALDSAEMLEGYRDGFSDEQEPGDNRSVAYWHGWRNGHGDKSGTVDAAQAQLAYAYVERQRATPKK